MNGKEKRPRKRRTLWPYLLFALLGIGLALAVTLQTGPKQDEGLAWDTFKAEQIKALRYESPKVKVHLTRLSTTYGWLDFTEQGKATQTFLVGSRGKTLWFNLSPLWASKVLGEASGLKLSDYGLAAPQKSLHIELTSAPTRELSIGGRGFQSSDFFVLDRQKQAVFLWNRQTLDLLERAPEQLSLSKPEFLNPDGLNKIVLLIDGKMRTMTREAKEWQEAGKHVFAEDVFLKWLDKVSKAPADGFSMAAPANGQLLFSMILEGENAFQIRFMFDQPSARYWISFGDDKPILFLNPKTFGPLYEEFVKGKFAMNK